MKLFRSKAMLLLVICLVAVFAVACGANVPTATKGAQTAQVESAPQETTSVTLSIADPVYKPEVGELKATWRNQSDQSIMIGEGFTIEQRVDDAWVEVPADEGFYYHDISIGIDAGGDYEKTYPIQSYRETFTAGEYRLKAMYGQNSTQHTVTAEFVVE